MSLLDRPGPLQGRNGVTPAGRAPSLVKLDVELAGIEGRIRVLDIYLATAQLTEKERVMSAAVRNGMQGRAAHLRTWIAWEEELAS